MRAVQVWTGEGGTDHKIDDRAAGIPELCVVPEVRGEDPPVFEYEDIPPFGSTQNGGRDEGRCVMSKLVAITNTREYRFALSTTTREMRVMLQTVTRRDLPALRKALVVAELYDLRMRQKLLRRVIKRLEEHHG
jgi:hypothetical protein